MLPGSAATPTPGIQDVRQGPWQHLRVAPGCDRTKWSPLRSVATQIRAVLRTASCSRRAGCEVLAPPLQLAACCQSDLDSARHSPGSSQSVRVRIAQGHSSGRVAEAARRVVRQCCLAARAPRVPQAQRPPHLARTARQRSANEENILQVMVATKASTTPQLGRPLETSCSRSSVGASGDEADSFTATTWRDTTRLRRLGTIIMSHMILTSNS